MEHKIILIAAPSGSGKSTITNFLIQHIPQLSFSISAATRPPRGVEKHGVHYYFISINDFENKIKNNEFAEWENVYEGKYYGTTNAELERIWNDNKTPLLDIDVKGALKIKEKYGKMVCDIFIKVPNIETLKKRLEARGTETQQSLQERINKATYEMSFETKFTNVVVNDNLQIACNEVLKIVQEFLL